MGMNSLADWRQGSQSLQANWFKYRLFRFWEQQQGAPKLHAAAAVESLVEEEGEKNKNKTKTKE